MSTWNDRLNKIKKECKISYPYKGEAMVGYFAGLDDMHTHIQSQLPIIIREIVKEAVGEMDKIPEDVQHKGIHFINEHKPIYRNQLRSEILSNIEKVIGVH